MSTLNYVGGCQCGSVRFETVGELTNLCVCHCSDCRRSAGAPMVAWGTVARKEFRVTHGRMAEYRSSAKVTRGFCPTRRAALPYAPHDGHHAPHVQLLSQHPDQLGEVPVELLVV